MVVHNFNSGSQVASRGRQISLSSKPAKSYIVKLCLKKRKDFSIPWELLFMTQHKDFGLHRLRRSLRGTRGKKKRGRKLQEVAGRTRAGWIQLLPLFPPSLQGTPENKAAPRPRFLPVPPTSRDFSLLDNGL